MLFSTAAMTMDSSVPKNHKKCQESRTETNKSKLKKKRKEKKKKGGIEKEK